MYSTDLKFYEEETMQIFTTKMVKPNINAYQKQWCLPISLDVNLGLTISQVEKEEE